MNKLASKTNINLKVKWLSPELIDLYKKKVYNKYYKNIKKTKQLFNKKHIFGEANEWLLKLDWKIPVSGLMFDDLINTDKKQKILEIAGSLSWFTLELLSKHDYTLIEKGFHENLSDYKNMQDIVEHKFVILEDWYDFNITENYDLIIANDLFPNADQRLYEFIDKYIDFAKNIRLTLTYSENTFFEVKRLESGETLYMRPWGLRNIKDFFNFLYESYNITTDHAEIFAEIKYQNLKDIVFQNNRNILFLELNISQTE